MIDLYFWTTPNGYKPLLRLEEAAIPYDIYPVNISEGEQFEPVFARAAHPITRFLRSSSPSTDVSF